MGNLFSILLSIVALAVSVSVAFYTQRAMNKREVDKSRREMLTQSVASLIEKSASRNETIRDWETFTEGDDMSNELQNILLNLERGMVSDLVQIQIAGNSETCAVASSIYELHAISQENIVRYELSDLEFLRPRIDQKELQTQTDTLVKLVRKETGLN